ncbi:MAG TPA: biotin/lipoyl-containing protein, partial [Egibacteraceae bacterium]|nr:biotin/lipoyl-containing protein [Egibacteraceae bacterium]
GFPLLIKPAAGGGGKGMRAAAGAAELAEAIAGARREARAAFADDRLLLEALIPRPRHLEIQILADTHGAAVHLGERECSLQRRHQKIIEECPSPLADAALRQRMGTAALDVARACDYVSAGTVEFIVPDDAPESFYFLEMNTRLQVEHPVTEAVYGVDLVEQQLRIAAGEPLAFDQADLRPSGHAIEARVYAEDPARGFLPTGGRVLDLVEPAGEGIRVDSGIVQSDTVTSAYDPLLMKVIAHAETRGGALRRLDEALSSTLILGLGTNTGFLRDLVAHPDVVAGKLDTGLVERDLPQRSETGVPPDVQVTAALARLLDLEPESGEPAGPFDLPGGWRLGGEPAWLSLRFSAEGSEPSVVRVRGRADAADVEVADGPRIRASAARQPDKWLCVSLDGQERRYRCASAGRVLWLGRDGRVWALREEDQLARGVEEAAPAGEIISPMPGSVIAVHVAPGQSVEAGKPLIVVEAMKMEHVLTAPIDGVVAKLLVDVGDRVQLAQPLAVVEEQR